jgi:hypothetical protein
MILITNFMVFYGYGEGVGIPEKADIKQKKEFKVRVVL